MSKWQLQQIKNRKHNKKEEETEVDTTSEDDLGG